VLTQPYDNAGLGKRPPTGSCGVPFVPQAIATKRVTKGAAPAPSGVRRVGIGRTDYLGIGGGLVNERRAARSNMLCSPIQRRRARTTCVRSCSAGEKQSLSRFATRWSCHRAANLWGLL